MDHPLLVPLALPVSKSANFWPLPVLRPAGFFANPHPTPTPANVLFDDEMECCCITLQTSPPVTPPDEVLILGAILGDENRVVLAEEERRVTVGIL